MKKDMLKLVGLASVSFPLLFGCDKVKNYSYETVQSYMGGTVTDVWAETKVRHSGSGIGRTSWTEDVCKVTVKFEDGVTEEEVEEEYQQWLLNHIDSYCGWEEIA